ncbi:MAG: response regulator [Desulfobacterales bacterium]|nr:response regulator [Desulfobacterales bacterium]
MKDRFIILIADKNPHVRKFIQRELVAEGFGVRQAVNGRDVLKQIYCHESIDLLVIDPDLPDADELLLFKKLHDRIPALPLVIHAHVEYVDLKDRVSATAFVEKNGNSIERLNQVVYDILHTEKARLINDSKDSPNQ